MEYKVMIGDVMVLDRDLIEILRFAKDGIEVHKVLMPENELGSEAAARLDELAKKVQQAEERLKAEFCIE